MPSPRLSIASPDLVAEIDPLGAQLSVLRNAAGRDLLWNGDPTFWSGRAPILFPIVGTLNGGHYRLGDTRFALPRHGFARGLMFTPVDTAPGRARLRLTDDDGTRAVYPFSFTLDVEFAIEGPALTVTATVRNPGPAPLPASLGFHPALRWPLPRGAARAAHFIEFGQEEPAPIRRLDAGGLLDPEPRPTPVRGRRLELRDHLFTQDVVIFEHLRSRHLIYGTESGPRLRVSFPDATWLGLWTKPGAGFICIEPWKGVADPAGFEGEFGAKPGVFIVPPGGDESLTLRLELEPT